MVLEKLLWSLEEFQGFAGGSRDHYNVSLGFQESMEMKFKKSMKSVLGSLRGFKGP